MSKQEKSKVMSKDSRKRLQKRYYRNNKKPINRTWYLLYTR